MLLEPYAYLKQIPGKDVRGHLIDCFQAWLQIPEEKVAAIKDIIDSLHNASLLIDDIEDGSKLRRGVPVAHSIYGVASTINCANYVYFLALEKCQLLQSPHVIPVFVTEVLNLHRGQGLDILWRDQCRCPTEDEYNLMVKNKTGGLFRMALRLMQAFSSSSADYTELLDQLSLYFQIRDDYVNLTSSKYMASKSYCEDLTEGKFSFPIIHAVHQRPDDTRLLNILRQKSDEVSIKQHAVQWMKQCGSFEYTRQVLRDLKVRVLEEIVKLGGHENLQALVEHLDKKMDAEDGILGAGDEVAR